MAKKNILYLHGYRMNKEVMKFQSRKVIKILPNCNHIMINAKYKSNENPPRIIKNNFKAPFYEHCQFKYLPDNKIEYYGIEDSIQRIKKIIIEII